MGVSGEQIFSFGEFELDGSKRLLRKGGKPVPITSKVFDLLWVLVLNHGRLLTKDELLDTVWEGLFIEENNLSVHISTLRKIFGEKKGEHNFIVTLPGKGYQFIAEIQGDNGIALPPAEDLHPIQGFDSDEAIRTEGTLIGRTREIAEIKQRLREDTAALITLTGTGGSGKTSLAKVVGNELLADFEDGVFFIELAAVNTPELVILTIAKTLGVVEIGGRSLIDTLTDHLCERHILLILDNFEQVISAAALLKRLATSSRGLKILVTSRRLLQIDIENEIPVSPLAVPPLKVAFTDLNDYAAIELFVRRAKSNRRSFEVTGENAACVAEICRRLDGLPLAIELAAARVKFLSPQSILERLENSLKLLSGGTKDLPERQRTMRGAISWSYELLDENEQELFRRLTVFAGGFTVEAAETVCENNESEVEILDLLSSLVDNNLLNIKDETDRDSRLQMLEVVREFAFELLKETDELDDLRRDHAQFFLSIAEKAEPFLEGESGGEWHQNLENDHDNIRAALRWSLENDPPTAVRIASAVRHFWINYGYFSEGFRWCQAALQVTENTRSEARLLLLATSGMFLRNQGNLEAAQRSHEKGLAESREMNNTLQIARNNQNLGVIAVLRKDYAAAKSFYQRALDLCHEIRDETGIALLLNSLGDLEMCQGNFSAARPLLEECRLRLENFENQRLLMTVCVNLGMLEYHEGAYETATTYFSKVLQNARETNNKVFVAYALDGFAALAVRRKIVERSAELAGAAENLRESIAYQIEPAEENFRNEYLSEIHAALDNKTFIAAYEKGQALEIIKALELVRGLNNEPHEIDTEIVIETHKYQRIVLEDISEPEQADNDIQPKQIQRRRRS